MKSAANSHSNRLIITCVIDVPVATLQYYHTSIIPCQNILKQRTYQGRDNVGMSNIGGY